MVLTDNLGEDADLAGVFCEEVGVVILLELAAREPDPCDRRGEVDLPPGLRVVTTTARPPTADSPLDSSASMGPKPPPLAGIAMDLFTLSSDEAPKVAVPAEDPDDAIAQERGGEVVPSPGDYQRIRLITCNRY